MNRLVFGIACACLSIAVSRVAIGDDIPGIPQPNPVPVVDPDRGSIVCKAASDPVNKINCWISRSTDRAVAVYVYEEEVTLPNGAKITEYRATLRQYLFDGESYASTKTKIMKGTTQLIDNAVIPVKLVSQASPKYPQLYQMVFTSDAGGIATEHVVGHLNFVRGNKQRASSKVSISLAYPKNVATDVVITPSPGSPCDEPTIDDIGEEEEIAKSPTISQAPTNFVLPIVVGPN